MTNLHLYRSKIVKSSSHNSKLGFSSKSEKGKEVRTANCFCLAGCFFVLIFDTMCDLIITFLILGDYVVQQLFYADFPLEKSGCAQNVSFDAIKNDS